MTERVLLEEFHLAMNVPRYTSDDSIDTIRRTFASRKFRAEVRQAVTRVLRSYPDLDTVRVGVTV